MRTCITRAITSLPAALRSFVMLGLLMSLAACLSNKYTKEFTLPPSKDGTIFVSPQRVTIGVEANFAPHLSKNGQYVLFTSDRSGNKDIWEKRVNGGYARQITNHPADDFGPALSRNGKYLAFVSRRDEALGDVYITQPQSASARLFYGAEGSPERIVHPGFEDDSPAWFPDHKQLLFVARRAGDRSGRIMIASRSNLKPEPYFNLRGDQPIISEDGNQVIFVRDGALILFQVSKKKEFPLTAGGLIQDGQPSFAPDAKTVVFVRYADDTNSDGRLDGDDRPSLWKLNIEDRLQAKGAEGFDLQPLSSASYGAYQPQMRPPYLYFARQDVGGIDIYRLNESGQLAEPISVDDIANVVADRRDANLDALYVARRLQFEAWQKKDHNNLAKAIIYEMRLLKKLSQKAAIEWLLTKTKGNLSGDAQLSRDLSFYLSDDEEAAMAWDSTGAYQDQYATNLAALRRANDEHRSEEERYSRIYGELKKSEQHIEIVGMAIGELLQLLPKRKRSRQLGNLVKDESLPLLVRSLAHEYQIKEYYKKEAWDQVEAELSDYFSQNYGNESSTLRCVRMLKDVAHRQKRENVAEQILEDFLPKARKMSTPTKAQLNRDFVDLLGHKATLEVRNANLIFARRTYKRILEIEPNHVHAAQGLVDVAVELGEMDAYEKDLKARLSRDEKSRALKFEWAYLMKYRIEGEERLANKIKLLDEGISEVEAILEQQSHEIAVYELLGWYYCHRGLMAQEEEKAKGVSAYSRKKWKLFWEYFGFRDPVWFEFAVDSYLNAFFLSSEQANAKIDMSLQLGFLYHRIGNFRRALYYYMERIKGLSASPLESLQMEGLLYQRAADAAAQSDNPLLAEGLLRKAFGVYEGLKDQTETMRVLDAMGVAQFEQGRFQEALDTYTLLRSRQNKARDKGNLSRTQSNIALMKFKMNRFEEALTEVRETEADLVEHGGEEEKITIGLGAEKSGYDQEFRRLLNETIRIACFENLGAPHLAAEAYKRKKQLLESLRAKLKDKSRYNLDFAILSNNEGESWYQVGQYRFAAERFLESMKQIEAMKGMGDKTLAPDWFENLFWYLRSRLEQEISVGLGEKERKEVREHLSKGKDHLEKVADSASKLDQEAHLQLLHFRFARAWREPFPAQDFAALREKFEGIGSTPKEREAMAVFLLSYPDLAARLEELSKGAQIRVQNWARMHRRRSLSDSELAYYMGHVALKDQRIYAANDFSIGISADERELFQKYLKDRDLLETNTPDVKALYLKYRESLALEVREGAMRFFEPMKDPVKRSELLTKFMRLSAVQSDAAIGAAISPGVGLISLVEERKNHWRFFLQTTRHLESFEFDSENRDLGVALADALKSRVHMFANLRRFTISGAHRVWLLDWKATLNTALQSSVEAIAFVLQPEEVIAIKSGKDQKLKVAVVVGGHKNGTHSADLGKVVELSHEAAVLNAARRNADLMVFEEGGVFLAQRLRQQFVRGSQKGQRNRVNDAMLSEWAKELKRPPSLVVFRNSLLQIDEKDDSQFFESGPSKKTLAHDAVLGVGIMRQTLGVTRVLVTWKNLENTSGEKEWQTFYSGLQQSDAAKLSFTVFRRALLLGDGAGEESQMGTQNREEVAVHRSGTLNLVAQSMQKLNLVDTYLQAAQFQQALRYIGQQLADDSKMDAGLRLRFLVKKADAHFGLGQIAEATAQYEEASLLIEAADQNADDLKLHIENQKALQILLEGEPQKAQLWLEKRDPISMSGPLIEAEKGRRLEVFAAIYARRSMWEAAEESLNKAEALFGKTRDGVSAKRCERKLDELRILTTKSNPRMDESTLALRLKRLEGSDLDFNFLVFTRTKQLYEIVDDELGRLVEEKKLNEALHLLRKASAHYYLNRIVVEADRATVASKGTEVALKLEAAYLSGNQDLKGVGAPLRRQYLAFSADFDVKSNVVPETLEQQIWHIQGKVDRHFIYRLSGAKEWQSFSGKEISISGAAYWIEQPWHRKKSRDLKALIKGSGRVAFLLSDVDLEVLKAAQPSSHQSEEGVKAFVLSDISSRRSVKRREIDQDYWSPLARSLVISGYETIELNPQKNWQAGFFDDGEAMQGRALLMSSELWQRSIDRSAILASKFSTQALLVMHGSEESHGQGLSISDYLCLAGAPRVFWSSQIADRSKAAVLVKRLFRNGRDGRFDQDLYSKSLEQAFRKEQAPLVFMQCGF